MQITYFSLLARDNPQVRQSNLDTEDILKSTTCGFL